MGHERILVVDGMNTFIRNFAVVPAMNSDGDHVGGIVGTIRSVKSVARDAKPTSVVAVWDGEGGSQRRRSIYSEYKSGRKPRMNRQYDFESAGESYRNMESQLATTKRLLTLLGVQNVEVPSIEADDAIVFICRLLRDDAQKVILSSDNDFFQLIDGRTVVFSPTRKKAYGVSSFVDEYNVLPENYIIVKALMGDSSDNIGGIRGIGAKTAAKLFPFLRTSVSNVDEVVAYAAGRAAEKAKYAAVAASRELLISNVELMQLASPEISATAARSIRESIEAPRGLAQTEFRLALATRGIQIVDGDVTSVFREVLMRSCLR